ncbi:prolyl oligopeptidase family serine peptidase [Acrocarpospora macrocephala]|uniref:prolyl oligopeptidase n=1 Tax=Acrocarpospora macrocephala TaxID=150177 RepID=A0A5M3WXC7_9ACTN|nr:prolyl oligopeptidase family serine peptidase [Acrocarpospora macrocephala]GES14115.1 prolyl endopeptidase [Acrocarpospora macrocephala]
MTYPDAERQPIVDVIHGHRIEDPYRWLEDPDSPQTEKWLAAQDDLWRTHSLPARPRLRNRIAQLTATGVIGTPTWRGERAFRLRREPGQEHAILYVGVPDQWEASGRLPGHIGEMVWRVVLDPMVVDPAGTTTLDDWHPSPDGKLVTVQLSRRGEERAQLYVLDVMTGDVVDGPVGDCRYSPVAWLPSSDAFYYIRGRMAHLRRLRGDDLALVEADGLALSADGRWLTLSANRGAGNDIRLCDLAGPEWRQVEGRGAKTAVTVAADGRLYVATTQGAPRVRLGVGDPADPNAWRDLVPEDPQAVLTDFALIDGALLVTRIRHAIGEINVHDPVTGEWRSAVPLPGHGSIGRMSASGHQVWFTYADYVTPESVYRYDVRTGQTTLWEPAPGRADLPEVESHQIEYPSADGTLVRMVVLSGPSTGPRPCILYGYGGFGVPLTPAYSSYVLPWIEAGGIFAFAQIRGGGEEGEDWHRAGTLDRKQNVFHDFAAAAETLITGRWTTPDRLGICGESNGGLLVGAMLTQRPDLFAAAVCSAPVLDMARYELSGLGPRWRAEYGSASDPDAIAWLLRYSPYHHVREGVRYPATLFTVFGGDTRVDPSHARKMCAALQHATAGPRPILLRHESDVGHGARAASRSIELAADMLAFFTAHL